MKNNLLLFLGFITASLGNIYAYPANYYSSYQFDNYGCIENYGQSFTPASDSNGYVITYLVRDPFQGTAFNLLMKVDSMGNTLWSKKIPDGQFYHSVLWDTTYSKGIEIKSLYKCKDNKYLLVLVSDTISQINPAPRIWNTIISFTKFDDAGNFLWTKSSLFDSTYSINNLSCSFSNSTNEIFVYSNINSYIAKYDSLGNFLWSRKFADSSTVYIQGVIPTSTGGIYVSGFDITHSIYYLFLVDSSGNSVWERKFSFNYPLYFTDIKISPTGKIFLAANYSGGTFISEYDTASLDLKSWLFTDSIFGNMNHDIRLIPLSNGGILSYIDTFYVLIDSAFTIKSVIVAGYNHSNSTYATYGGPSKSMEFNNRIVEFYTDGLADWWIQHYESTFLLRELHFSGANCISPQLYNYQMSPFQIFWSAINLSDSTYKVPLTSYNSSLFDSSIANSASISTCFYDFLDEYNSDKGNILSLSPNPASSTSTIHSSSEIKNGQIEIFNLLGKKVVSKQWVTGKNEIAIDVQHLSPGLYFVKVQSEKGSSVQKLIIQ